MGGDLLRVNPLAEFICSVYGVPAGAALVRLRSLASSHRRYLVDVSVMDSKPLKAIPGDLVKLGRGLGVQFERFTQPSRRIDVNIEANPWLKERDVRDALEELSFVDSVDGVKQLRLKNGNPTARFDACIGLAVDAPIEVLEGGGGLNTSNVLSLKVDESTRTDDVPGQALLEARNFFVVVKVGKDGPTINMRRALECSFCSLNSHLNEECQVRVNLLSGEVGITKIVGWNVPAAKVIVMDEDADESGEPAESKTKAKKSGKSQLRKQRDRDRQKARKAAVKESKAKARKGTSSSSK